jgi:hypothetical protein
MTILQTTSVTGTLSINSTAKFQQIIEKATIAASAAGGTVNFDVLSQLILYYTSNASANWTVNVRGSSTATLASTLPVGETMTLMFLNTNGATPRYPTAFQIDGTTASVRWQGNDAPSAGTANSLDIYTYSILRTGSSSYTVFGSFDTYSEMPLATAGQQEYTTPGSYSWICPSGVTRVSVVCVGGGGGAANDEAGGGAGGGLAWKNNISVIPGQTYSVVVGAGGQRSNQPTPGGTGGTSSAFGVFAYGGTGTGNPRPGYGGVGGGYANADGGGNGGDGGDGNLSSISDTGQNQGGGGAGGYTGNGGRGADHRTNNQTAGSGGGGGGGANGGPGEVGGGGGGGVGIYGQGANGVAGTPGSESQGGGGGGSGGQRGFSNLGSNTGGNGGSFGGGGGADDGIGGLGGSGAVRIIWSGSAGVTRSFPSTNTGNL